MSASVLLTLLLGASAAAGCGAAWLSFAPTSAEPVGVDFPTVAVSAPSAQAKPARPHVYVDPARFAAGVPSAPRMLDAVRTSAKAARPHAPREVIETPSFMLIRGDGKEARLTGKQDRLVYSHAGFWKQDRVVASADRFDAVAGQAWPKLAATTAQGGGAAAPTSVEIAAARFGKPAYALAYATPSGNRAALALETMTGDEEDQTGVDLPQIPLDEAVELPDEMDVPDLGSLPVRKPAKVDERATRPDSRLSRGAAANGADDKPARQKPTRLAFARPDNPARGETDSGGSGWGLRNLFGKRAGNGVAVYDISAARVYMPDGSVLEAHSGIGKMADNPRYTHVKMNGATPPHTYNLRMRESRFHGVEAIRMLPVDGKNKYGRTGLLTHSYLLRGRAAQSHGCVAFKDYSKFLKAFKQGKIKQLVVVNGGGSAVARVAKRLKDA